MAGKDGLHKRIVGRFVFDGMDADGAPELTLTRVDADGTRTPVPFDKDGNFALDASVVGKRAVLEIAGPDGSEPRRLHFDEIAGLIDAQGRYVIPKSVWDRWRLRFGAVSGSVESCRPLFLFDSIQRADLTQLSLAGLGAARDLGTALQHPSQFLRFCRPVCDGTVDVYVQTCCCPVFDPGQIIDDICKVIDCAHLGEVGPVNPPVPDPIGPVAHVASVIDSIRRAIAGDPAVPGPDQIVELFAHHEALVNLDRTAQVAYIEAHPALRFLHCHCTLVKVASVAIHEDGTFDATFVRPFAAAGCTQRLVYVVRQATPSGERVIYDGRTGPVSFGFGEEADLKVSWLARTCSRDDLGTDVGVYLNRIGATSADHLVRSVDQDGELSFAPLAAGDGLVNGGANVWGGTLALRYSFHQNLKGLGAVYYRVRIQQVDDLGDPVGAPVDHSTPVAWGLKQGTQIVQTALGPKPAVATVNNLYTIPFYADGWDFDANSFHALIDTTALVDNGRYLFGVDIFDQNGARLVPADSGATGAGEAAKAFVYQRMNPSADPAVVNLTGVAQKALANLFRVDNTAAVAAFSGLQQIRAGSVVNDVLTGCQYLAGLPTDELRIRYRAHHDAGWLDAVSINVTEGIGGPTTPILSDSVDTGAAPATALTPSTTLAALLGTDVKCSFASTMLVTTRHTNGSGGLSNLWASATGAFALEQTAP